MFVHGLIPFKVTIKTHDNALQVRMLPAASPFQHAGGQPDQQAPPQQVAPVSHATASRACLPRVKADQQLQPGDRLLIPTHVLSDQERSSGKHARPAGYMDVLQDDGMQKEFKIGSLEHQAADQVQRVREMLIAWTPVGVRYKSIVS